MLERAGTMCSRYQLCATKSVVCRWCAKHPSMTRVSAVLRCLDCIVIEQVSRLHLNPLKHSRASYRTSHLQCCCLASVSYPR